MARPDPKRVRERLLEQPLFAGLETFEVLGFEVDLFCDPSLIPPGRPPRPSYFRLESRKANEVIVTEGDLTTELVVLLSGGMSAFVAEPERGMQLIDVLRPGDWFGEVSALSHSPALSSFKTDQDCELAILDARLFNKLYREEEAFHDMIDRRYREKSLPLHLKTAPLFRALSRQDLARIKDRVEFITYPEEGGGELVASEGDEADAFLLVRSGAVKCRREDPDGRERILAYYMGNSSFGEHVVATTKRTWPGAYETLMRTDLVRVPRDAFEEIRRSRPDLHRALTITANLILGDDSRALAGFYENTLGLDEIDVMVNHESVKGGEALVIDKAKCIRCNACVEACVSVHDDRVPRITKVGTRVSSGQVLITACYHCAVPDCMASCNYGAIRRDAQGVVVFVYDNCVGCASCVEACPYDVIRMTEPRTAAPAANGGPSWWERGLRQVPLLRRFLRTPAEESPKAERGPGGGFGMQVTNFGADEKDRTVEVMGKAIKCDLCAGLPFEACVYNCPTFAISRRRPEDLFRR